MDRAVVQSSNLVQLWSDVGATEWMLFCIARVSVNEC